MIRIDDAKITWKQGTYYQLLYSFGTGKWVPNLIRAILLPLYLLLLSSAVCQGPIVLMGVDAEDGGLNAHGPISSFANVVRNIYYTTTLVI